MIKYNNNTINDWNFGTSNLIKVYRNNAIVFYKVSGESPTPEYKVCFAVVDDISQYTDREFEDVFDNATEKWYKLNNLNQYEEYGVYGSGRTSCGGSSRLPQGYTEVEYIENTTTAYINTEVLLYDSTTNSYEIETKMSSTWGGGKFEYLLATEGTSDPYNGVELRWNTHYQSGGELQCESVPKNVAYSNIDNGDGTSAITISCTSTNATNNVPLSLFCGIWSSGPWRNGKGKIYDLKITKNDVLVRDLVPCKRDSDDKYGMYDIVNDVFYISPNNVNLTGGDPTTPTDCVTTYKGKLTIDEGYEYEWNGSSWDNLGEVSGSSITIKSPEYIEKDSSHSGKINLDYVWKTNTKMQFKFYSTNNGGGSMIGEDGMLDSNDCRVFFASTTAYFDYGSDRIQWSSNGQSNTLYEYEYGNYYIKNMVTSTSTASSTISTSRTNTLYLGLGDTDRFRTYYLKFYDGDTLVKDFIPWTDMNGNYGLFDKVSLSVYNVASGTLTGSSNVTDVEVGGGYEYPKYYTEKSDPLNDLTFNTLDEAQTYAYNNCVYDGMHATIDGYRYYFDSSDENGWVKVTEYYTVEDVTPNQASGWTISGSSTYNPNSSYYDDFDLETTSTNYVTKIAKVTIYGYDHFTYYMRTSGYSSYNYVVATNVDEVSTPPSTMSYNSSSAIANTFNWNKYPKSDVNLSNYRRITYNNLDKTVEHTFYVYFYGRTYSSYVGNATILIPKEQTNENWEQVTFSASSNVASTQKNLYIDNNNSTSGGTNCWYYRWMIGLPSGSHSSNTNYSNYEYCPNVTSSTFTSVAGEQRQVNFTYDGTTNKNLSFRLVDGNGNVLTPSDTVYYNMTYYNSCGISTSESNKTFPAIRQVKVGGRFRFANSSNRHYIYGYSPNISLNYDYYVDNYMSTFDIVYTKLSDEAVTITYTTFDPNDVETPTFNTDITYPYSGGTTSSTTLSSYDVPYTYSYTVKQTNNLFSASTASYTYIAGQSSRTITFTLYPNNREFATVADMEAYAYAWEGMKAKVDGTAYTYENGEWTENQYVVPSGYTELKYCTVPKVSTSNISFKIENNLNADYIYTFQFTPNTGFYDSYYGCITTSDGDSSFKYYGIFKLDNGWGVEEKRNLLCLYNYKFDTRVRGNIPDAFRYYIGTKATVTMKLHNPSDASQGADLTVENEGYSTVTRTSTSKFDSSWTVVEGEFDMPMFTANQSGISSAQINYHNFKVEDTQGNLIYDYRPVTRLSDNKVGLYDVVKQQFFYPTGLTLTAGPSV